MLDPGHRGRTSAIKDANKQGLANETLFPEDAKLKRFQFHSKWKLRC